MQHLRIWTGPTESVFDIPDEWPNPVRVTASPVVTSSPLGTTVGLLSVAPASFGYWRATGSYDLPTAWRAAQLLPRLRTLRAAEPDIPDTLTSLVRAVDNDRNFSWLPLADDLGLSPIALETELTRLRQRWPTIPVLRAMWDRLPAREQDRITFSLQTAIDDGHLPYDQDLVERLQVTALRLSIDDEQRQHENDLIATGLPPATSLQQFLLDIGVHRLVDTANYEDPDAPEQFDLATLDQQIMRELIGDEGFWDSLLLYIPSEDQHGGVARHPRVVLDDALWDLTAVSWDRPSERFTLLLRPADTSSRSRRQYRRLSIEQLRTQIGADAGLDDPLPPGQSAPWCTVLGPNTAEILRNLK